MIVDNVVCHYCTHNMTMIMIISIIIIIIIIEQEATKLHQPWLVVHSPVSRL